MNHFPYQTNSNSLSISFFLKELLGRTNFIISLIFLIILISTSKINPTLNNKISDSFINISLPIAKITTLPINLTLDLLYFFKDLIITYEQNANLKIENQKLKSLYINAINIHSENLELKKILKFTNSKISKYQVARLIGHSENIYSQNIFVDIGANNKVQEGDIVVGNIGLIGRIGAARPNNSTIMLISDINSKIPVISDKSRNRGILVGTNSNILEILYLSQEHTITLQDRIFTSSDGETIPPGILIGDVIKIDGQKVYVKMTENINNIELVSVISY